VSHCGVSRGWHTRHQRLPLALQRVSLCLCQMNYQDDDDDVDDDEKRMCHNFSSIGMGSRKCRNKEINYKI